MDDILLASGVYDVARMGLAFAGKVGGYIADEIAPSVFNRGIFRGCREETGNKALRSRVLDNIAISKAGRTERNIENFAIYDAKESQITTGYNADSWIITSLQKDDIVYGGLPGQSAYYTTEKTLIESGYSREKLYQSLQVKPDPIRGYR